MLTRSCTLFCHILLLPGICALYRSWVVFWAYFSFYRNFYVYGHNDMGILIPQQLHRMS
uniref:Uncharacterized protein n=1 Tax=Anopheles albimanus TaxID=7167 RepID=A0A182FWL9_ANOAL